MNRLFTISEDELSEFISLLTDFERAVFEPFMDGLIYKEILKQSKKIYPSADIHKVDNALLRVRKKAKRYFEAE